VRSARGAAGAGADPAPAPGRTDAGQADRRGRQGRPPARIIAARSPRSAAGKPAAPTPGAWPAPSGEPC